jgi:hypothetical protein
MGRKSDASADIKSAGGIGESRVFRDPQAATPEIYSCHIDGRSIADLIEAGDLLAPPPYALTDEGIQERVDRIIAAGNASTGRISLTRDSEDKKVDAFEGTLKDNVRFSGAIDPFAEVMKKYVPAGYTGVMLNDAAVKHLTTQGCDIFLDKDGNRVQVGDAYLGIKPIEQAQAETKFYRNLQRQQESASTDESFREQQRKAYHDEGVPLPPFLRSDRTDPQDPGVTDDSLI